MKISHFMSDALFKEKSGYYRTKNPIGKDSDFITSPEISQVFGELLAAYILEIASHKNCEISLVEMGAGKGTLFKDILNSIKKLVDKNISQAINFINRSDFHIIEINEALQKIQQENLSEFNIVWHNNFADFLVQSSKQKEIFFISNELFDCFPLDQFVFTEGGWRERIIENNKFTLALFKQEIHDFVEQEINCLAPIGAVFEYSKAARELMKDLCDAIKNQGGVAINIDYGYVKNEFLNTLQAVKNHKKVDVLQEDGADITALVDFCALEKIVKNCNLQSSIISQSHFLRSLGIEERRKSLLTKNIDKEQEINLAIDRLISSDQMGELFKCLIIWR